VNDVFSLAGKTALVAGASRGIGLAIAQGLAAAGAHTVLAARSMDKLEEHARALTGKGHKASAVRDHHNKAWSIALAGAGIPGGRVLGATDAKATEVTDFPVEPEDLLRTIYSILGVDSTKAYQTPIGRPSNIVNGGRIIPGLVA